MSYRLLLGDDGGGQVAIHADHLGVPARLRGLVREGTPLLAVEIDAHGDEDRILDVDAAHVLLDAQGAIDVLEAVEELLVAALVGVAVRVVGVGDAADRGHAGRVTAEEVLDEVHGSRREALSLSLNTQASLRHQCIGVGVGEVHAVHLDLDGVGAVGVAGLGEAVEAGGEVEEVGGAAGGADLLDALSECSEEDQVLLVDVDVLVHCLLLSSVDLGAIGRVKPQSKTGLLYHQKPYFCTGFGSCCGAILLTTPR